MKTCKRFQQFVTRLAQKHDVDISQPGAHLRLENEPYMPLVVEKIGFHLVSVAHSASKPAI